MNGEKFIDVDGFRTRYLERGSETGEPMVLVHGDNPGNRGSAQDWEYNIDGLAAAGFRVFAVDKIGCGYTDNPRRDEDYVIGSSVAHVAGFIRALGVGPVHLVGHSRGGYTVTRMTLEHPELVRTLVIVDSSSLMTPPNPNNRVWEEEALRLPDPREQHRYALKVNSFAGDHITEPFLDAILAVQALPKTAEAREAWSRFYDRFQADIVARQAETHEWIRNGGITCPTLVVWAWNDPSATMDRCGIPCMKLILPSVPRSEMHILNRAGHFCFREQPAAFNGAVVDFIRRYTA
jgi:2-hydroxy-6-oxonona-2,4-dienedioate hydrolase